LAPRQADVPMQPGLGPPACALRLADGSLKLTRVAQCLDGQGTLDFWTRSRSAAGRCFEPRGVARTLDRDRGRGAFDLGEVVPRQLDIHRAEVLLEPVELCATGDRHDPRLLPEEPRDRDLRGSRVLLFRDSAEQIDKRLIGLHCLRFEARQNAVACA